MLRTVFFPFCSDHPVQTTWANLLLGSSHMPPGYQVLKRHEMKGDEADNLCPFCKSPPRQPARCELYIYIAIAGRAFRDPTRFHLVLSRSRWEMRTQLGLEGLGEPLCGVGFDLPLGRRPKATGPMARGSLLAFIVQGPFHGAQGRS